MKFIVLKAVMSMCFLMTCLGCGKSEDLGTPIKVTGVVTLDAVPLEKATVGFVAISPGLPAKYRYVAGVTDSQGAFILNSVYPAEYTVTLNQDAASATAAVENAAVPGNPKLAKYGANSPLKAVVSKDSTAFKFDATSGK